MHTHTHHENKQKKRKKETKTQATSKGKKNIVWSQTLKKGYIHFRRCGLNFSPNEWNQKRMIYKIQITEISGIS